MWWRLRRVCRGTHSKAHRLEIRPSNFRALRLVRLSIWIRGHFDCIALNYCSRDPRGANDCSMEGCSVPTTETPSLQRCGIIGGSDLEASANYGCCGYPHFEAATGTEGQLSCHSECSGLLWRGLLRPPLFQTGPKTATIIFSSTCRW